MMQPPPLLPGFRNIGLVGIGRSDADGDFWKGITRFRGHEYPWILHDLEYFGDNFRRLEEGIIRCDAVLARINVPEDCSRLQRLGLPVHAVLGGYSMPQWILHDVDWVEVGRVAARWFLDGGHRHACFVSFLRDKRNTRIWSGFRDEFFREAATLQWFIRGEGRLEQVRPSRSERSESSFVHWFGGMPRPMALLASDDALAEKVGELALHVGVSVPEELALLGIGNHSTICETCYPPLSSVRLPTEALGRDAAVHLAAAFRCESLPPPALRPPCGIEVRHSTGERATHDPVVARALALMRRGAASGITIKEVVGELPLCMRRFTDRFRAATGRSPREEMDRIRLSRACQRLQGTDHTVERIAANCGFPDAESMARLFRRAYGETPTAYRRRARPR